MTAQSAGANIFSKSGSDRGLHVLTLTPFYPSAADDANGCFVAESLESIAKLGIRNTVMAVQPVYRRKPGAGNAAIGEERCRYFSLPGGIGLPTAGAFLFARIVARLRMLHCAQPIDLIHAHGPLPCGHAAMLVSRELKIPFVVSVHGLDAFSTVQVGGRSGEWCRRISQAVYGSARQAICISEHVREAVLADAPRSCRASVVYNGVDPERFVFAPEEGTVPKILSVGNLIPIKGHNVVIRALAALAHDFPSLQLEIIGEGPERSRLEGLAAKLTIADRVHFRGRQSRAQVAEAMRGCMIFALPSRYEGLGCVYLEAMSCGKPVVGCEGQGIAEIVHSGLNGFLVAPDDEKQINSIVGALLRDPTRRREMGRLARETIVGQLTLEHQATELVKIYRECAL